MRLLVTLVLALNCAAASAAVTCEQFANIAVATQQMRDQGYSLADVLAEADKLRANDKFTAQDIDRLKDVVDQAFKGGGRMPLDLLKECKDNLPR